MLRVELSSLKRQTRNRWWNMKCFKRSTRPLQSSSNRPKPKSSTSRNLTNRSLPSYVKLNLILMHTAESRVAKWIKWKTSSKRTINCIAMKRSKDALQIRFWNFKAHSRAKNKRLKKQMLNYAKLISSKRKWRSKFNHWESRLQLFRWISKPFSKQRMLSSARHARVKSAYLNSQNSARIKMVK